jgi:N-acetylmuramoyl-L-alanine amidase
MIASAAWLQFLPGGDPTMRSRGAPSRPAGKVDCVIIDAGHGGRDSGAIRAGVQEKDLTLDVALRVARLVRAQGLRSVLTRETDEAVSLGQRAAMANRERDCVFVSIHFDEGGRAAATGVQTFYAARPSPPRGMVAAWFPFLRPVSSAPTTNLESRSLAELVQESLVARTRAFNRGVRTEQFYVVANVRHPAVLVEGGFLSNSDDVAKLATENYREELAIAISEGILRYCELSGGEETAAVEGEPRI